MPIGSLVRSLVALIAVAAVAGCAEPDPLQLLAQAKQLKEKGDNKAALISLNNALQLDPGIAEARYLVAAIRYEAGDYPAAEEGYRKALELGFDPAMIQAPLAWTLLMQRQYQKVLDETKSAPESADILSVRGGAQLSLGQAALAASSFEQALKLDPQFAPALLGQARMAVAEQKLDRATELVNSVLQRTPRDVGALFFSGDLHHYQTNNDKAAAAYSEIIKIQPANFPALLRRATVLAEIGQFDAAQADIDAARKVTPRNPAVDYTQALLLFRRGKPTAALEIVQKVLSVAPNHMPSLLLAGLLHYSLNSLQQAEGHVNQFIDRSPNSLFARKLLVSILLKSNQGARALQTLEPLLKSMPKDAQLLAMAGEAYMQLKQFTRAAEYLRRAASIAPADADLQTRLGMTALALGETDRAVAQLESASKLDVGFSRADTLLVMTYLGKKEYDKALEAALKLQEKEPKNPAVYDLLGGVYLGQKDRANARKSFERALSLQPDYTPAAMMLAHLDLSADDANSARSRFKVILAKDGKNVQAMIGLASVERAMGNSNEYASWLEKARSADSTALMPRLLLVSHYLQKNDATQALAVATEAKNIQPKHPDVLNLLGEAQSASNDKAGAVTTYASLVSLVPQSPLAHYRLATAYMGNVNYAAAADSLKKALKLKADYVDAMAALAMLEYRAARYSESLSLAQQIQRQAPKLPVGYTLEGDTLMAQKKFALAEKAFEKAFAVRRGPALAIKLHVAASQAGKTQEANSRLLQWLRENPGDTTSRFYLADAYVKSREYQSAIQQYELILKKDPDNFLAASNLATVYRQEKDPRALEYFEKSYKLKPDNATIAHSLGWMLVEQDKLQRGLELLRKASSWAPYNPEIGYHLAFALAKSGEKAQARRELERILENKSDFPYRNEAQALLKQL